MELDLQFFGGRGASSHRSGSKSGGSGGSLDKLKLPTLEGSAKQIAWAKDIRKEALGSLKEYQKAVNKFNVDVKKEHQLLNGAHGLSSGEKKRLATLRKEKGKIDLRQEKLFADGKFLSDSDKSRRSEIRREMSKLQDKILGYRESQKQRRQSGRALSKHGVISNSKGYITSLNFKAPVMGDETFKSNASFRSAVNYNRKLSLRNYSSGQSKEINNFYDTFTKKYGPKSGETWSTSKPNAMSRYHNFRVNSLRERLKKEKSASWWIENGARFSD